jgi:hypothetical protein
MRCVQKGKNVNVPLTDRIMKAHLEDLKEWLKASDGADTKALEEREVRVKKYWTEYLKGNSDISVNEKP